MEELNIGYDFEILAMYLRKLPIISSTQLSVLLSIPIIYENNGGVKVKQPWK